MCTWCIAGHPPRGPLLWEGHRPWTQVRLLGGPGCPPGGPRHPSLSPALTDSLAQCGCCSAGVGASTLAAHGPQAGRSGTSIACSGGCPGDPVLLLEVQLVSGAGEAQSRPAPGPGAHMLRSLSPCLSRSYLLAPDSLPLPLCSPPSLQSRLTAPPWLLTEKGPEFSSGPVRTPLSLGHMCLSKGGRGGKCVTTTPEGPPMASAACAQTQTIFFSFAT